MLFDWSLIGVMGILRGVNLFKLYVWGWRRGGFLKDIWSILLVGKRIGVGSKYRTLWTVFFFYFLIVSNYSLIKFVFLFECYLVLYSFIFIYSEGIERCVEVVLLRFF